MDTPEIRSGTLFGRDLGGALSLLALVASILLAIMAWNEIKSSRFIGQDIAPQNTITVTGEGEMFAPADTGTFTFGATAEAPVVADAQTKVTTTIDKALAFLKEQGVEERDIKTVGYDIYPRYEYRETREARCVGCPPVGQQVLVGFTVTETISVKVRDVAKSGALLGGIGGAGASNISGLTFTIDDEDGLRRQARQEAITKAKAQAEELARDLGVRLVRITSFTEGGAMPAYAKFDMAEGRDAVAQAAPQVPVGENRIVSHVTLTYEIKD